MNPAFLVRRRSGVALVASFAACVGAQAVSADDGVAELGTLTVTGEAVVPKAAISTRPEALPTAVYVLDEQAVEAMPFTRATDLLRSTPGITFGSSSPGSDLGDDISIRGFSSYHGADAAVFVDGVPINWSHGPMRHGFVDLNWLVPEMIERIEIIKGPFSAEYGNFNLSGVINIVTKDSDSSGVALEAGGYESYRGVGTFSRESSGVTPFLVYEYYNRGGYREHSGYERINAFNKFSFPLWGGRVSVRLSAAQRDSEAAGFVLADDVRSGAIDRRSASPDSLNDTGYNDNYALVANYVPASAEGMRATLYAGHDRFELIDTAFGPPTGVTRGERNYAGWRVSRNFGWEGRGLVTVGSDGILDDGSNRSGGFDGGGLDVGALSRDMDVSAQQAGVFVQGQWMMMPTVKLIGGVRYDYVRVDVENHLFPTSGDTSADAFSPKIGFAWAPIRQVELFVNTGKGFRSPAHTEVSPSIAGAAFNDDLDVAELVSTDIGVTLRPRAGLEVTAAWFTTATENELRRDPANPLNIINIGETDRDGYELMLSWMLSESVSVSAGHVAVDTSISDSPPGADRIVTVPEDTQTLSVSWRGHAGENMPAHASFFVQRIGDRPLTADGALMAEPQTTYGAKLGVARGPLSGFLQVEYAPDEYVSDFVFDVGGLAYDPQPVWSTLAGVRYTFR